MDVEKSFLAELIDYLDFPHYICFGMAKFEALYFFNNHDISFSARRLKSFRDWQLDHEIPMEAICKKFASVVASLKDKEDVDWDYFFELVYGKNLRLVHATCHWHFIPRDVFYDIKDDVAGKIKIK